MGSVYMLAGNEITVLKGNFDCLKSSGILNFYEKPIPFLAFTLPGCPSRSAPPALVMWGAGRRISIIPAGFGCEVGMDAWVGGCWWGVDMRLVWV